MLMKKKTPKTIADLNITWTFYEDKGYHQDPAMLVHTICAINKTESYCQFRNCNPDLVDLVVSPNSNYIFVFKNKQFRCGSYDFETLGEYFVHLNQAFWMTFHFHKEVNLEKFERVSDTKYIIHGK